MKIKETVRVLLVNSDNEALMIKVEGGDLADPNKPIRRAFWITPGGRIEDGETPEQAVTREVFEETGIQGCDAGPMFGYGEQILEWKGVPTLLKERFFCVRVRDVRIEAAALTEEERSAFQAYKWWSADEMRRSGEVFLPKDMPKLLEEVLTDSSVDGVRAIDLSSPDV